MDMELYGKLLSEIKVRIRQAQVKATLSANAEMITIYWDVGRMIDERQKLQGWSAAVIPALSKDLKNELPELKGFSERNLGRMLAFYREYQSTDFNLPQGVAKTATEPNLPQPVAKLQIIDLLHSIPWGHHALRDVHKPIGISEYELTRSLPDNLKSSLPSIEEIEAELGGRENHG